MVGAASIYQAAFQDELEKIALSVGTQARTAIKILKKKLNPNVYFGNEARLSKIIDNIDELKRLAGKYRKRPMPSLKGSIRKKVRPIIATQQQHQRSLRMSRGEVPFSKHFPRIK